jgi:hypothetical protein
MPRTPDLALHALWRERLRRQVDSALTIADFCAREGFAMASFHYWKRRLRLIDIADCRPALPGPPAFLPVTVWIAEHALGEPLPIVADLPNGIRLRIPTADAHLVCRLVVPAPLKFQLLTRKPLDSIGGATVTRRLFQRFH